MLYDEMFYSILSQLSNKNVETVFFLSFFNFSIFLLLLLVSDFLPISFLDALLTLKSWTVYLPVPGPPVHSTKKKNCKNETKYAPLRLGTFLLFVVEKNTAEPETWLIYISEFN